MNYFCTFASDKKKNLMIDEIVNRRLMMGLNTMSNVFATIQEKVLLTISSSHVMDFNH